MANPLKQVPPDLVARESPMPVLALAISGRSSLLCGELHQFCRNCSNRHLDLPPGMDHLVRLRPQRRRQLSLAPGTCSL